MTSATRTRARKATQAQAKADKSETITQEEAELAAAQENELLQDATLKHLQNRVATLRVEVNRLHKKIAELEE